MIQFVWIDKIDGVDDVSANDINTIGQALQQLIDDGLDVPTKLSQLINDMGFVTDDAIPTKLSQLEADSISGYVLSISASALELSGGSIHINKADYGFYVDGNRIQNVATPEDSTDAANKAYVDGLVGSVESALDSILSLQNSLIGGDA